MSIIPCKIEERDLKSHSMNEMSFRRDSRVLECITNTLKDLTYVTLRNGKVFKFLANVAKVNFISESYLF